LITGAAICRFSSFFLLRGTLGCALSCALGSNLSCATSCLSLATTLLLPAFFLRAFLDQ
jgi:hypothetical protein